MGLHHGRVASVRHLHSVYTIRQTRHTRTPTRLCHASLHQPSNPNPSHSNLRPLNHSVCQVALADYERLILNLVSRLFGFGENRVSADDANHNLCTYGDDAVQL